MKCNKLNIRFKDRGSIFDRLVKDIEKSEKVPSRDNEICFESYEGFLKFFTMQRYSLLIAIKALKPISVYDLAKKVKRDLATVQRDCNALSGAGFIDLVEVGDQRKSRKPQLRFNYHEIVVHSPIVDHSLNLPKGA